FRTVMLRTVVLRTVVLRTEGGTAVALRTTLTRTPPITTRINLAGVGIMDLPRVLMIPIPLTITRTAITDTAIETGSASSIRNMTKPCGGSIARRPKLGPKPTESLTETLTDITTRWQKSTRNISVSVIRLSVTPPTIITSSPTNTVVGDTLS